MILIPRLHVRPSGEEESLFGSGDSDGAVIIDQVPLVILVELRQIFDELAIDIDELAAKEPLAPCVLSSSAEVGHQGPILCSAGSDLMAMTQHRVSLPSLILTCSCLIFSVRFSSIK